MSMIKITSQSLNHQYKLFLPIKTHHYLANQIIIPSRITKTNSNPSPYHSLLCNSYLFFIFHSFINHLFPILYFYLLFNLFISTNNLFAIYQTILLYFTRYSQQTFLLSSLKHMHTPNRFITPIPNSPITNFTAFPPPHLNQYQYALKFPPKTGENLQESNHLNRYSSQQSFKSYSKFKLDYPTLDNSPQNYHHRTHKKSCFILTRKNSNGKDQTVSNFMPVQIKRNNNTPANQEQIHAFKCIKYEQSPNKQLKETSSTNSNENILRGEGSDKSIPTFLKGSSRKKRNFQQISSSKGKNLTFNSTISQPTLSMDSFEIIRLLGEGKFASVYLAVERRTGLIVALKRVQKKRIIEQNFLTQFIRQLKIQAFLDHPNIAKIYGFFQDENHFYSILELGEGGQLYNIIKNGHQLTEESTSFIIGNLLDAISYLHDRKILHRDIKPENIVLVHGNVKLCDFGWAVYKNKQLRTTFCGTPLYLSPELLNGQKYDQKVDLWALGVLAFQLHVGSSPFCIQDRDDLLKIVKNQIEYPDDYHVSKEFKQFIEAVLKKDPKQRLQAKQLKQLRFIKRYRELQICQELCH